MAGGQKIQHLPQVASSNTPVRQSAHACAFWVEEKRLVLMRNKRLLLIIIKVEGKKKSVLLAKGSDTIS